MERTDKNTVKRAVPKRPDDAHKGVAGTLLCICGSYSMAGAAILAGTYDGIGGAIDHG